jgi:NADPH:quinone reductase-like Zn-dependent oxidoreductase
MQAVVYDRYGDADVLRVGEMPRPAVGDHEVLVQVRAAGLDRGAWHFMTGTPYLLRLGAGLRRAGLTFVQAAAVPISGLTALQGLRDAGRVRAGQQVLITGASGGVGSFAVQLGAFLGAEVTGVAGTAKLDLVRSLGARHVLDHSRDDFADGPRRYDLILDLAGNPALSRLRRALTPTGTAVIAGGEGGGDWTGGIHRQLQAVALSPFVRQRLTMLLVRETAAGLDQLADLVGQGALTPSVGRVFPFDQAPAAMRHLAAGRARGKIVVEL